MSVEDRLRRVLADAVATEPQPEGAAFERVLRRRRRPLMTAAVALALLLIAAVALTQLRARDTRPVSPAIPIVPADWKEYRSAELNLGFRYPPDWVVRVNPKPSQFQASPLLLVPPEFADRSPATKLPFVVAFRGGDLYYLATSAAPISRGQLPNGRAYTAQSHPSDGQGRRFDEYYIDAGRSCVPRAPGPDCGPHSFRVAIAAATTALWDRYRPLAATVVGSVAPVRATTPTFGDRTRPPCRPDLWRLASPAAAPTLVTWFQGRSWLLQGSVRYPKDGPPCHMRITVQASVERSDGASLTVPGTPAMITIEGDLPEDRDPNDDPASPGYSFVPTPLSWQWGWQNWCKQPLSQTRVRISAAGKSQTIPVPPPTGSYDACRGLSPNAPWRISPQP